jgi:hypothetical protein
LKSTERNSPPLACERKRGKIMDGNRAAGTAKNIGGKAQEGLDALPARRHDSQGSWSLSAKACSVRRCALITLSRYDPPWIGIGIYCHI